MKWLKGLLINIQFFTSVPIRYALPMDEQHIEKAIKTFPILGLFQGIFYASFLFLFVEWSPFSPLAAAFFLWLITIILTGGIHLDGWMDTSDAYFSYQSIEKRLEIMSDPRTGAFGVISVIILLSTRFFFIYELVENVHLVTYLLIGIIPFFSKTVMGMLLLTVNGAKKEGLATLFQNAANERTISIYPMYIVIVFALLSYFHIDFLLPAMILNFTAICCYFMLKNKIKKWFGGITGDVVGASVEGTELVLWMMLWLLHYFVIS